jgi:hypothetical protein
MNRNKHVHRGSAPAFTYNDAIQDKKSHNVMQKINPMKEFKNDFDENYRDSLSHE